MKSISIIALFICVVALQVLPVSSYAEDFSKGTGSELITMCHQGHHTANDRNWNLCIGYVAGVDDGFTFGLIRYAVMDSDLLGTEEPTMESIARIQHYCFPEHITRNQEAMAVAKYLKDNPGELKDQAQVLVIRAFQKSWPCAKSAKNSASNKH